MKKKSLFLCSGLLVLCLNTVTACSGKKIVIWVGSESVEVYTKLAAKFQEENPEFGYAIDIVGADTGTAAASMIQDNTAVGDAVTIAHDNIGKLSQLSYIAPIVDSYDDGLSAQIDEDNSPEFLKAITNILGNDDRFNYTFAVPYISQALFLYYDTRYVTNEQAQSFEGLMQAAADYDSSHGADGTKAFINTGVDGYNFSFSVLHRNISAGNISELRLYEGGDRYDCYNQFNEQVAVVKWMQRVLENKNGTTFDFGGATWDNLINNHKSLSVIGGAWHFNAFKSAVGEENVGCAPIPTFTLTAADVEGIEQVNYPDDQGLPEELRGKVDPAPTAGTVLRGGSFVDCKCFVINMASVSGNPEKYTKICQVLKYFSNKTSQQQSFKEAYNVPAYMGSDEYIATLTTDDVSASVLSMAKAQTGMTPYGIPQPFSSGTLNTYYYSKNCPDYYVQCIKKNGSGDTVQSIREVLFKMEYVWKHGATPAKDKYPSSYPAETTEKRK